jgi:hypothetical protein
MARLPGEDRALSSHQPARDLLAGGAALNRTRRQERIDALKKL